MKISDQNTTSKKRVLVWGLSNNRAGTENVIRNVAKACEGYVDFDFLTTSEVPNHFDLFEGTNNRLFVLPPVGNLAKEHNQALANHFAMHAKEYSALWFNCGDPRNVEALRLAYKHGIPRRILHAHNSNFIGKPHEKVLAVLRRRSILPKLTDLWACSDLAGIYMFKGRPFEKIPNAIPFEKFAFCPEEGTRIRRELNIPIETRVIGSVGRLEEVKNNQFIIKLLAEQPSLKNVHYVMVGEGALERDLKTLANKLEVSPRVHFVQSTASVASYYSLFDVLALPSFFEGLPLVLIEAQANGLPAIISDVVSEEAILSNSIIRLPLSNVCSWSEQLERINRSDFRLNEEARLFDLENQSQFFIDTFSN